MRHLMIIYQDLCIFTLQLWHNFGVSFKCNFLTYLVLQAKHRWVHCAVEKLLMMISKTSTDHTETVQVTGRRILCHFE